MRITIGELDLDAQPGVLVRELVAFARSMGEDLPDRPWCGPVALLPDHAVGLTPLVAFARLGTAPGPDARPQLGVHLAVIGGPESGAVATVSEGLVIGRGEHAGLRLEDASVSTSHARLARGRISDLSSRNGVAVRGRRVYRGVRYRAGDVVRLGESVLTVRDPSLDGSSADAPARAQKHKAALGFATGGAASLTMVVFALSMGNWLLGLCALAVPFSMA